MKQFIAFLVCAFLTTALAKPNEEKFEQSLARVKAAGKTCNADPATRVDIKQWGNVGIGDEKPANLGAHALCVSKILGWQKDDGSVNVESIRSKVTDILGEHPKLEEMITECTQAQDTPEATAVHLLHCYRKHTTTCAAEN